MTFYFAEDYAKFYLEMSNWNVHQAVGNFFDFGSGGRGGGGAAGAGVVGPALGPTLGQPPTNPPSMVLVKDLTVGEGESVPPSTGKCKCSVFVGREKNLVRLKSLQSSFQSPNSRPRAV